MAVRFECATHTNTDDVHTYTTYLYLLGLISVLCVFSSDSVSMVYKTSHMTCDICLLSSSSQALTTCSTTGQMFSSRFSSLTKALIHFFIVSVLCTSVLSYRLLSSRKKSCWWKLWCKILGNKTTTGIQQSFYFYSHSSDSVSLTVWNQIRIIFNVR